MVNVVNFASEIDQGTVEQAAQTAALPFVYPHVALMPDAHVGKGAAVGTVIPTLGAVIPAAVGVDIGCGMIAARTRFTAADIAGKDTARLRCSLESAIPLSAGNYNKSLKRYAFTAARIEHLDALARDGDVDLSHSPKWRHQLGTLGGGNHFIELCVDEDDAVWMFLHSGSRGVGNKIATRHINVAKQQCRDKGVALPNADLAYLEEGTAEFDSYIAELRWAQAFALAKPRGDDGPLPAGIRALDAGRRRRRRDRTDQHPSQLHHAKTARRQGSLGDPQGSRRRAPGPDGDHPGVDGHPLLHRARQGQPRQPVQCTARRGPPFLQKRGAPPVHRRRPRRADEGHRVPPR
jgi:tRNA-splicing ligase RtcB